MGIDKSLIVSALRELGVRSGDILGLHSSIPSLGRVLINIQKEGGNEAIAAAVHDVIDGFYDAVGREKGLVMVPTFTYCYAGGENPIAFHLKKTKSRVGQLTELFLERPDAKRSLQPTHSVAAIGGRAEEIIKDHEKRTGLGVDSPFDRLAKWGGWICYLGTNSKTLSLLHVAETIAEVPHLDTFPFYYLGWTTNALIENEDGTIKQVPLKDSPGCSGNFGKFDELMEEAGILRRGKIFRSQVVLFKADEALELAVEKLKEDPFWLLCPKGKCRACDVRWEKHG